MILRLKNKILFVRPPPTYVTYFFFLLLFCNLVGIQILSNSFPFKCILSAKRIVENITAAINAKDQVIKQSRSMEDVLSDILNIRQNIDMLAFLSTFY